MPTRGSVRSTAVLVGAAIALVVLVAGCGGSSDSSASGRRRPVSTTAATAPATTVAPATVPPTTVPATTPPATFGAGNTPETAIAAYEVARTPSRQFAGPCADTELPRDVGKWCSALLSDPTDTRTYSVGPAFAESEERLTLVRTGAIWSVTAHEPSPRPGG
jgi:hypothetical protein